MAEAKAKVMTQYCIDANYALEAIRAIPKSITIETLGFAVGTPFKRRRLSVPNRLKKFGVNAMSETVSSVLATGVISGSRKVMVDSIKTIAVGLGVEPESVHCRSIRLALGDATATFTKTTKEIHPDETDQRKKLKVLGMSWSEGNTAPMIKELSAEQYQCTFEIIPMRKVICSKKGV